MNDTKNGPSRQSNETETRFLNISDGEVISASEPVVIRNPFSTSTKFNEVYDKEETPVIEYHDSWANGTGYYDNACKVFITAGQIRKSYDSVSKRRLILVGTRLGTIVVFERYAGGKNGIYVSNWNSNIPSHLRNAIQATSSLSADTIETIIGDQYGMVGNIGQLLESIYGADRR